MSAKRVLVIGATGAMGQYVVPELAALGYEVDAVALDLGKSELPNVHPAALMWPPPPSALQIAAESTG